jgi:uncharacterized membrane protein
MDIDRQPSRTRLVIAAVLLGVGLGGFFDGIVLHQILQWHHMISTPAPPDTLENLELNTLGDGTGLTLVPLSMYFKDGWVKVELGIARGLKSYDKRQVMAERDAKKEIAREMGRRLKGRR